jgi:hypothetical protein
MGTLAGDLGPEFAPQKEFYCVEKKKWLYPVEGAVPFDTYRPFAFERAESEARYKMVDSEVEY